MKRPKSTQGNALPKRHCPPHQLIAQNQGFLPVVNQNSQFLYNSNHAYGHLYGQPTQQSPQQNYCYNYNNNNNYNYYDSTNVGIDGLLQNGGITNGWSNMMQYPASQVASSNLTPAQFPPSRFTSAQPSSTSFTSAQFTLEQPTTVKPTDLSISQNVALGVGFHGGDTPLAYPTHVSGFVSKVNFPMQNEVLHSPPIQPLPTPLALDAIDMPIGANITPNGPDTWNKANVALNQPSQRSVYGAQVKKPKTPRQPIKRGERQGNSDAVDLVMIAARTLNPPTPSPTIKAPPIPIDQPTGPPQLPNAKEPPGASVKPCEALVYSPVEAAVAGPLHDFVKKAAQQEDEARRTREKKQREEAEERQARYIKWPGDPAELPAEVWAHIRLPGCEFRAHAIYVGCPRHDLPRENYKVPLKGSLAVYAVRRGSSDVEFKVVVPDSTPDEVTRASEIQFSDIILSVDFCEMDRPRVIRWTRYLMDAVPGNNDSVTMWSRA
ncbi:hypothetical protein F4803DRAFT_576781 [Xylaria telfairii]|nr:hypothetical protein F4803DRAFT_576781 [Xylaria telfairii]